MSVVECSFLVVKHSFILFNYGFKMIFDVSKLNV
jgi:hypothetical protein